MDLYGLVGPKLGYFTVKRLDLLDHQVLEGPHFGPFIHQIGWTCLSLSPESSKVWPLFIAFCSDSPKMDLLP